MKAIVQTQYGSPEVLQLVDVEKPEPADNEVLVKIHATTVTATEAVFRQGKPYFSRLFTGLRKPRIQTLGEELAGEVVAVGKDVTTFKIGDHVFGTAGPNFGANAEYLCVPEDEVITRMPSNLSYGEAAASVDGFLTALPFLRDKGNIQSGQSILINGASGSIGSVAVQIAKHYGAEVTGVCSGANVEWVKSLGADHVTDYTQEDFTQNGQTYDIIFDTVGKITFSHSEKSLKPEGIFLMAGMGLGTMGAVLMTALFGRKKAKIAATGLRPPHERVKDLYLLKELMEDGTIIPVIDRCYPLEQIAEAHRYVDTGRKKGNVVIDITPQDTRIKVS
jgi:NADPH:quinone reductase-like Zn-dependent oxidoreductase